MAIGGAGAMASPIRPKRSSAAEAVGGAPAAALGGAMDAGVGSAPSETPPAPERVRLSPSSRSRPLI